MRGIANMKLLLLAGSGEARDIARALLREPDVSVAVSIARQGPRAESFGWPLRVGGWGGEADYRRWVRDNGFDAVIDATHPFAEIMSNRAARVSRDLGLAHLRVLRPAWVPTVRDKWISVTSGQDAANVIPEDATVFLGIGRGELDAFSNLGNRRVYCRVRDAPVGDFPFANGAFLFEPGPFTVRSEHDLFVRLGVDWLVVRNSGGTGSWPKLETARELGLSVAMLRRPPVPDCPTVPTTAEALNWVRGLR
jgi:precorrin-6A/cobalt-precorrin-6A reductase